VSAALPALVDGIDREARRTAVERANQEGGTHREGIDFVEVVANYRSDPSHVRGAPQQRTLLVHLLDGAVSDEWQGDRVQVLGGVRPDPRVNPVGVEWAHPVTALVDEGGAPREPLPPAVTDRDCLLVDNALPRSLAARRRVLVVRTTTRGDWSTYVLGLFASDGKGVPPEFDGPLSLAPFSFTVDCPSDLDCCPPDPVPAPISGTPLQDYLARDYEALRGRLADRLSTLLPGRTDRSPADPVVMLAELFAYLGDRLAYWQDAVAVEAYLGTARRRTSVRRHGRLLGYAVHEGCSARVWLALRTDVPATLAAGAAVADTVPAGVEPLPVEVHGAGAAVFETAADVDVLPARNEIPLHPWGDPAHELPAGATSAFLAVPLADGDLALRAGDVLVLADLPAAGADDPGGGPVESGDPGLRQAVRLDRAPVAHADALRPDLAVLEIHWHPGDALVRPLTVSEPAPDGGQQTRAVALANVVLADHGASVGPEPLDPPQPTPNRPYGPQLPRTGVAFVDPAGLLLGAPEAGAVTRGAGDLARPDPRAAGAALVLDDGERTWIPQPDLIASGRSDPHVVVEPEPDGGARLRFGDGVNGRSPGGQATFAARYRLGGGPAGDVAAGRLTRWLWRPDGTPAVSGAAISCWNPLPAGGGSDPEDVEQVRQLAPSAYRRQLRAVTTDDYAAAAQTVAGVQRSVDRRRWAGSWYTHEVTVDPLAARADDPAVPQAVRDVLEVWRMAGVDVEVARPVYVPLLVQIFACLAPGYLPGDVEAQLLDVLSARTLPGGGTGLFHPDRFTFGSPLYVSDVVATAMGVPGVAWVDVTGFARLSDPVSATAANLAAGAVRVEAREVLRCDTDPNDPEAGRVEVMIGGLA
jgi:hypothetical protein